MIQTSLIFLSGGSGNRMNLDLPKQYHLLNSKPIFSFSLETLLAMGLFSEVIVVADSQYHELFEPYLKNIPSAFAPPGVRRQDSVLNGLEKSSPFSDLVCIHDSARPFPSPEVVKEALKAAKNFGASALATPVIDTLKRVNKNGFIEKGLDRSNIWAMQTPQIVRREFLEQGYLHINKHKIEVTDDVAILEHLNIPVKIIPSPSTNFKISYPEDIERALFFLKKKTLCATS